MKVKQDFMNKVYANSTVYSHKDKEYLETFFK